jgi:hypothetical protein
MRNYLSNKAFWLKSSVVAVGLWLFISAAMFHFFSLMALFWFFVIGAGMWALVLNAIPFLYEAFKSDIDPLSNQLY